MKRSALELLGPDGASALARGLAPVLRRHHRASLRRKGFSGESLPLTDGRLIDLFRAGKAPKPGTPELLQLFVSSPWLRMVVGRVNERRAAVEWRLWRITGKASRREVRSKLLRPPLQKGARAAAVRKAVEDQVLEPVEESPFWDVWERPHRRLTGLELRTISGIYEDIAGEVCWIMDRRPTPRAWPGALTLVAPQWIRRWPSSKDPRWEFRAGTWEATPHEDEVIWFRQINPLDPYGRGVGVASALADEVDADEQAAHTVGARLRNRGIPDLLVSLKDTGGVDAEEVLEDLEDSWSKDKGPEGSGRVKFAPADLVVQPLAEKLADLNVIELRRFLRNTVVEVYGVPPETLGIVENSNRATSQVARELEAEGVQIPRLERQRARLQTFLIDPIDPSLLLTYEDPTPEDREAKARQMGEKPWAWPVDEHRRFAGDPPLPEGRGKWHMVPAGIIPMELPRSGDALFEDEEDGPGLEDEEAGEDSPAAGEGDTSGEADEPAGEET